MRVLFCSTGGTGHLQPMRPLAAALQSLGHAVGWVTAPDALPGLMGQGLALFAAGPTFEDSRRRFRNSHPEIHALRGEALSEHTFPGLFGDTLAPAMLDDIASALDRWQPDLVVLEPAALAAPLACQVRGVPHATHGYGLPVPLARLQAAMRQFGRHWQARGLKAPADGGLYRHLYIDIAPASLVPATDRPNVATLKLKPFAAPQADSGGAALPDDGQTSLAPTGHPRVYLSFGTVFHREPALREAAQALLDLGAEVVVSIGAGTSPDGWGPASPHLHVRRYVDQAWLLPHCDAVVSHGGAGTVLAAAAHGLPQLILPQAADHFRNARALSAVSAAIMVAPESQTAGVIRSEASRLLASAWIAAGAVRLAQEIQGMPSCEQVALNLQGYMASRTA